MPIELTCVSCGAKMRAADNLAGKMGQCPKCGAQFQVPTGASTVAPAGRSQWRAVEPAADDGQIVAPPVPVAESIPAVTESRHFDDGDDSDDDRPRRRSRRSRRGPDDYFGFVCPFCGTHEPPTTHSKISTAGWIMFAVLLVVVCPLLCWLGLLMKEEYRVCTDCGLTLG